MEFDLLKEIIAEVLNVDAAEIKLSTTFVDDLGADSLDAIELVCSLERTFGLAISDEEAMDLKTVRQIVDYVEAHE